MTEVSFHRQSFIEYIDQILNTKLQVQLKAVIFGPFPNFRKKLVWKWTVRNFFKFCQRMPCLMIDKFKSQVLNRTKVKSFTLFH